MKKLCLALIVLIVLPFVAATGSDCRGWDCECIDAYGDDWFGVAKYEWQDGAYAKAEGDVSPFTTSVDGDQYEADWTASPGVGGVVVKSGIGSSQEPGGTAGTVSGPWVTLKGGISFQREISHLTFCASNSCGDWVVDEGEECDYGPFNGEECSAGYGESCTYCTNACTEATVNGPSCGDGITNGDEECDGSDGLPPGKSCTKYCTLSECGNGVLEAGEECDDGNLVNGDGCSSTCTTDDVTITFCKYDADTEEPIAGWTLKLERQDGDEWIPWYLGTTDEEGCFGVYIPQGVYRAGEDLIAGWELDRVTLDGEPTVLLEDQWTQPFGFKPHGDHTLAFYNRRTVEECSLTICKRVDATGNGPSNDDELYTDGWNFAIVPEEGENIPARSDEDGCDEITLETGNYRIAEASRNGWTYTGKTVDGIERPNTEPIIACEDEVVTFYNYPEACGNGVLDAGEQCDDGNLAGGDGCSSTCEEEYVHIIATKIECDAEEHLPNYGEGGPSITATTAQDYVDASEGHCWLASNWNFQYGYGDKEGTQGVDGLTGSHTGEADGSEGPNTNTGTAYNEWKTFGPTGNDGTTSISVALEGAPRIWIRENLKEGYIPFSAPPKGLQEDDYTAELYCDQDVLNYDNYDYINNPQYTQTYYCVAWNAPPTCGDGQLNEGEQCDDGNNNNGDGCDAECIDEICTPGSCGGDACTVGECIPYEGCIYDFVTCDDENLCTQDSCDTELGCVYEPIDIDDGNACTTDRCDPQTGVTHLPVMCDDTNPCTEDSCDPTSGCTYEPVDTDDGDECTEDGCTPRTGVTHEPISCDDGDACTAEYCDSETGCEYEPVDCDDGDECTRDTCDPTTGCGHEEIPGCRSYCGDGTVDEGEECDDGNAIERDGCSNECTIENLTCVEAKNAGLLRGTITGGEGLVENDWIQSYDVGLAVYEKFDEIIDNQELYDSDTGVVPGEDTLTLNVELPDCAYQIDLFCGEVLTSLDGQRYGDRKLDWEHVGDEYCPFCGDGTVDEGEECDDGNNEDGDGCSSDCMTEEAVITFCKFDADTEEPISGWTLALEQQKDGNWTEWTAGTTDEEGCFGTIIPTSTYRATEELRNGWELEKVLIDGFPTELLNETTTQPFAVTTHDDHSIHFYNRKTTCELRICKRVDTTGNGPSNDDELYTDGWNFAIVPEEGENIPARSDEDGCDEITLETGNYRIAEASRNGWEYTGRTVDGHLSPNEQRVNPCENETVTFYNYPEACGNGVLDAGEQCDDGNLAGGDGCDAECIDEICTPGSCDDENRCTLDRCVPYEGCAYEPVDADDGNACTVDTCDPETGISHEPIDCSDDDACTIDSCDPALGCQYDAVDPNDGNACTEDSCDPETGVSYTPVDCDDGDACTAEYCDPETGCEYEPVPTDDGNACTVDACDPATGVSHEPVDCDDGDECTRDTCDPTTGCGHEEIPGCRNYCGDGEVWGNEECDLGEENGEECTPPYGGSCQYCTETCEYEEIPGPFCGDGITNGEEECDGSDGVNEYQTCTESCTVTWEYLCDELLHLDMEDTSESRVSVVDRSDASTTTVITVDEKLRSVLAATSDGVLYGMRPDGADTGDLVIISGDGSVSSVGPTGLPGNTVAMEFAPDGTLYAANQNTNILYTVNIATGAATAVGPLAFGVQGGDLVVTEFNELIYVKGDGRVFIVDLDDLSYALAGTLPAGSYTSSAFADGVHYAMDRTSDKLYRFTLDPWSSSLVGQDGPFQYGDGTFCALDHYCGDGFVDSGEVCDLGASNGEPCEPPYGDECTYCTERCEEATVPGPFCGDGTRQLPYEECDGTDGVGPHQECSETCELVDLPYCGDGVVNQPSEECDGNDGVPEGSVCLENCTLVTPECGNGVLEEGEQCDDGNRVDRDGCSSDCTTEELTCVEANRAGYLSADIDGGDVTVTNTWTQTYDVGIAVYKRPTQFTDDEVLYDHDTGIAPGEGSVALSVDLPYCAYELDVFCGEVLFSHDGVRYGNRKIDYEISDDEYCTTWCGDGTVDADEECEPSVPLDEGVCNAICEIAYPVCGNEELEYGEECDLGEENGEECSAGYGESCTYCTDSCTEATVNGPSCGDGITNGDEECDGSDGVTEGYRCTDECLLEEIPVCGDDTKQGGEECDNGAENGVMCVPTYGKSCSWCTESCELVNEEGGFCGDDIIEAIEECDDGDENGDLCDVTYGETCTYCTETCEEEERVGPFCGDGVRYYFEEECDLGEGNGESCDPAYGESCESCTESCRRLVERGPSCGDGIKNGEEECDGSDGVTEGYYCTGECTLAFDEPGPTCGDGVLEEGEQCDDGNRVDRDGCSSDCTTEELTCVEANRAGYLSADIDGGDVTVTNTWTQTYDVGVASYERPTEFTDDEVLSDAATGTVPAEGSEEFSIDVPECAYELDVFCGEVIEERDGQRYGDRKIASELNNGPACAYCGDGVVNQPEEECDGNDGVTEGYRCTDECLLEEIPEPVCGNEKVEFGEECDAGEENGEECSAGYDASCTYCTNVCTEASVNGPFCGDEDVNGGEECDDANGDNTDGCTDACLSCAMAGLRADIYGNGRCCEGLVLEGGVCNVPSGPYCGDENVDEGEECDAGTANGDACSAGYGESCTYCTNVCTEATVNGPSCGDGIVNGEEECDGDVTASEMVCDDSCMLVSAPGASVSLVLQEENTVTLNCVASGFSDPTIDWTMGDGTTYTDTDSVVHSYLSNGDYTVTCTASEDDASASDWTTVSVTTCLEFSISITEPTDGTDLTLGEEFTVRGLLTGETNTNGEEVLVNDAPTWVLTDDAWSKMLTAASAGALVIEATHENSCGAVVSDAVTVDVVEVTKESVDQPTFGDDSGGENYCADGYRKTSDGCERIVEPEVAPEVDETNRETGGENQRVDEPAPADEPSDPVAEPTAQAEEPDENLITGAAVGGGLPGLLWLFIVLALVGLGFIGYYVVKL